MGRYRLDVGYDGTAYGGWQVQPNARTIQGELERALGTITGETVKVHCSGRTDAGVHARGQVAHFDLGLGRPCHELLRGINAILDPDIRALRVLPAPADFHARRSAAGKEYRYFIWNAPVMQPVLRLYRAHVRRPLDAAAMGAAAARLEGHHDFSSFAANAMRPVESAVRNLFKLRVSKRGPEITISARGEGFLYKMVRSLAGFLIKVGEGELAPEFADLLLASARRTAVVPTAQPQGLFLWRVWYV